jgi:uncharacterized protein involved in exopolysaccharide biosynthesis
MSEMSFDDNHASGSQLDLGEYVKVFKRRRAAFFGAVLGVLAATVVVTFALPATYESKATMLVEQQEIPPDMVRTTISSYADQRIEMIQQRIKTRDNLMRIIKQFDLYPEKRDKVSSEDLLDTIKRAISLRLVSGEFIDPRRGVPTKATIAFELGFTDKSPEKAFRVANELVTLYQKEDLRNRNAVVKETSAFLAGEAAKLEEEIVEQEVRLAGFKKDHVNELPELLSLNWQLFDRTEAELKEVRRQIGTLESGISFIESDLALLNPYEAIYSETGARILSAADRLAALEADYASARARYLEGHPDLLRLEGDIAGLREQVGVQQRNGKLMEQIEGARAQLAAIRERYSDDHPDVIVLRAQIEALIEQVSQRVDDKLGRVEPTNPAFSQLSTRLATSRLELQSLKEKRQQLDAKRADIESRIAKTPGIEKDYSELARDYRNTSQKFQEVKAKQMEADLAGALEVARKGEKFTLIDPPQVPETPISPMRWLVFLIGVVLALGAGIVTVIGYEVLDPRVFGEKSVYQLVGAMPLGAIPIIRTRAESGGVHKRLIGIVGGGVLLGAIGLAAVNFLVIPLDAAIAIVLSRLGM